jgi:hypothetical protein
VDNPASGIRTRSASERGRQSRRLALRVLIRAAESRPVI